MYNVDEYSSKKKKIIQSLLGNTKGKIHKNDKSGIYSTQCIACNKCCARQTRRHLNIRSRKHLRYIKTKKRENWTTQHVLGVTRVV